LIVKKFSESIWIIEKPFKLMGAPIGNRCTIVRLSSGKLWVHSPVAIDESDAEAIRALGEVQFVVAPNNFHHLHVRSFKEFFPNAHYQGTSSLQQKRKDIYFDSFLESKSLYEWSNDLEHVYVFGMPLVHEVVFYHRKDKVLIIADLFFNFRDYNIPLKIASKILGVYQKASPSRLFKSLIWNRREFKDSLNDILDLDFDRIILSHGKLIDSHGKATFQNAYQSELGVVLRPGLSEKS